MAGLGKLLSSCTVSFRQVSLVVAQDGSRILSKQQYYFKDLANVPNLGRFMSMWPKGFEDPVIHKRDFPSLQESGEFETKALSPIKSAPNTATCSLFKDPLVQKFHRLCTVHGRSEVAENNLRVSSWTFR